MTVDKNQNFLRVFWPPYFPSVSDECSRFPTLHVTKFCQFPGLMVEILGIILKDANLTLISSSNDDYSTDIYPKGVYLHDLINMMANDSLDTMGMSFQKTDKREKIWSFSESLYKVKTRLLIKTKEQKLDKLWSFFETYSSDAWFAFLIAWLLQWTFCVLVRRFEAYKAKKVPMSLIECAWSIMRLQLLQPENTKFQSKSGNFAVCVFSFFQCSILLGVFSSFILASIITRKTDSTDPMFAMTEMIASGEYYMVTNDPTKWFFENINTSHNSPYPELREALRLNPLKVVETRFEALDLVANGNALLFQQVDEGSFFEAMTYCGIEILGKNMPLIDAHLVLRKNHPLMPKLNEVIIQNRQKLNGIALKYYKRAIQYDQCPIDREYNALTLSPYLGLSVVCLIFIGISFIILLLEMIAIKLKYPLEQITRVIELKKRYERS